METALRIIVAALLGLSVGSFLNVVVWRVPRGLSVNRPPSACPSCNTPIKPYDNIPVLSWVLLRGKCRQCNGEISVRYPMVELITGLTWTGLALFIDRIGVLVAACIGLTAQIAAVLLAEQGLLPALRQRATQAAVIAAIIGMASVGVAVAL
ncbi:MAG: prepilin peptidase [Acidimicrobiia bacterium]